MSAGALERAAGFVRAEGDALAGRAAAALESGDAAALVAWLEAEQRTDGGFPPDGSPGAARRVLSALADAGALGCRAAERACRFLEAAQSGPGCWEAGDEDARLYDTGLLAGLLARTRYARASCLDAAADWLAAGFAPERVQGFAWRPIAAYAACFANVLHDEADGILQWCGRELERGYRAGRFDAVATGRVLVWCDAPAIPGARVAAPELCEAILAGQEADGAWPTPAGVSRAAHALDAMAVLRRYRVDAGSADA